MRFPLFKYEFEDEYEYEDEDENEYEYDYDYKYEYKYETWRFVWMRFPLFARPAWSTFTVQFLVGMGLLFIAPYTCHLLGI